MTIGALFLARLALTFQAALDYADEFPRPPLDRAMRCRAWEWWSEAQKRGIVLG